MPTKGLNAKLTDFDNSRQCANRPPGHPGCDGDHSHILRWLDINIYIFTTATSIDLKRNAW